MFSPQLTHRFGDQLADGLRLVANEWLLPQSLFLEGALEVLRHIVHTHELGVHGGNLHDDIVG